MQLAPVLATFGALALLAAGIASSERFAALFVCSILAAFLILGPGLSLWQRMTRKRQ